MFQLPEPPTRDAVALIVHTSGTTGRPQPVEITFGNIRANARGLAQAMGLGDDERWLCPLPLSHVGGLMVVLRSALMATTAVLAPPPFDAERGRAQLRDGGITIASLVPTQLQRLLDAGATPGPELRRDPARRRPDAARAARARPRRRLPRLPELRAHAGVLDGDGRRARRPRDRRAAAARRRRRGHRRRRDRRLGRAPSNALGSLRTGDLGRLDEQGRLVVTGRKGDVIISGGENVAPAEVEAVLAEHPGVVEAAVFARPHPLWGEAITALVVPRAGAGRPRARCARTASSGSPRFKVPKAFELVDALPRTESGKVRRADLR